MGDRKQLICSVVVMCLLGMSVFFPLSARSAETMIPIQEAKTAIEQARQAGAEKTALDDLDQARSWLAQAEKVYADSQSILSRTVSLVVSNEARARELLYLADMAKTKARIAEAKARKATVLADLKNATKDLADYRTALEMLNKKLAEAEAAKGAQAKEVEELEARKKKALEETQKKLAELEARRAKELEEARLDEAQKAAEREKELAELSLKAERLKLQKEKEAADMKAREVQLAAEMKARESHLAAEIKAREAQIVGEKQRLAAMEEKMAAMEKEKAIRDDAAKIPQATVRASEKELVISLPTLSLFSAKNELHASGKAILDQVGAFLGKHVAGRIVVRGYTDSTGKAAANQSLSETRAQKVKEYLIVYQNILSSRITSEGFGATQPVASNDTEAGRALNRRVEVVIPAEQ